MFHPPVTFPFLASPFLLAFLVHLLPSPAISYPSSVVIGEISQRDTNRPTYEVQFPPLGENSPPHLLDPSPGHTVMRMVTARGQHMRCLLPPPLPSHSQSAPVPDENRFDDIERLLSVYDGKCYFKMDSYWTYKFCYRDNVVQQHLIPPGRDREPGEIEETYILGRWDPDLDLSRRKNISEVSAHDVAFTQLFVNGTTCDITGKPRSVLIKYVCADDAIQLTGMAAKAPNADLNLLKSAREVETCVYEIEFMNNAICQHETYREKRERATRLIQCSMEQDADTFEGLMSTSYKKASLNL